MENPGVHREPRGSNVFDSESYAHRLEAPLRPRLLLNLALLATAACAAERPALTVGDVTFAETELLGLSDARRAQLAEITAFGLAAAREELPLRLATMLEQARDAALLRQFAAERILAETGVDDDQLRAHYFTNPALELTVRHVLFLSERWRPASHRELAQRKAEAAIARLKAGESFPAVAAELSEEPGAEGRQGLLQPGREGSWVSEFWIAALALEAGEISPVTETQYGFHVLRLENRQVVSFEEARPAVVAEVSALIASIEDVAKGPLHRGGPSFLDRGSFGGPGGHHPRLRGSDASVEPGPGIRSGAHKRPGRSSCSRGAGSYRATCDDRPWRASRPGSPAPGGLPHHFRRRRLRPKHGLRGKHSDPSSRTRAE